MSSRFADPSSMRTRSPIYRDHDDGPKRPPPSPSAKGPPAKNLKLDAKPRTVSEEPAKAPLAPVEPCTDKSPGSRVVDMEVFRQILELDDGDGQEFSREMVKEYLGQTLSTIKQMDECFAKRDLSQLGKRGHFLKGSSAALGVVRVQEICEKIQHLGNRIDHDKEQEVVITADDALARIKPLLARLKDENAVADKWLKNFFEGSKP